MILTDNSLGTWWNIFLQSFLRTYKPVSYTHLDVYKRQQLHHSLVVIHSMWNRLDFHGAINTSTQ